MRAMNYMAVISLSTLAMTGTALAADRATGTYIGGGAGANFAGDNNVSGGGINADIGHETGFIGVLSLGQSFANGFRGEVELGNRRNEVDSSGNVSASGKSSVFSAMINGYYDFATGSAFMPYLGAGIGIGQLKMDVSRVGTASIKSSGRGIGLQGIAGVAYQMDDNWTSTLEYRYYNLQGAEVNVVGANSVDADYDSHSVMVGLRYTFGAEKKPMAQAAPAPAPAPQPVAQKQPEPKPAPAPVAPPAVARNYIVFFDWNKDDISFEALAVLKSAAENARNGNISRIQATGHADSSGTRAYNKKLSEKRARAVQATLNSLGIATNEITVDAKGELEPLVPTADGVREPQNRRVEIVFP